MRSGRDCDAAKGRWVGFAGAYLVLHRELDRAPEQQQGSKRPSGGEARGDCGEIAWRCRRVVGVPGAQRLGLVVTKLREMRAHGERGQGRDG